MVDTYPWKTIPVDSATSSDCIQNNQNSQPGKGDGDLNVLFEVTVFSSYDDNIDGDTSTQAIDGGWIVNDKSYHDDYTVPILINNYVAGDWIEIKVNYKWNNGVAQTNIPHDFTVSIYSQSNLKIYQNKTFTDS